MNLLEEAKTILFYIRFLDNIWSIELEVILISFYF